MLKMLYVLSLFTIATVSAESQKTQKITIAGSTADIIVKINEKNEIVSFLGATNNAYTERPCLLKRGRNGGKLLKLVLKDGVISVCDRNGKSIGADVDFNDLKGFDKMQQKSLWKMKAYEEPSSDAEPFPVDPDEEESVRERRTSSVRPSNGGGKTVNDSYFHPATKGLLIGACIGVGFFIKYLLNKQNQKSNNNKK